MRKTTIAILLLGLAAGAATWNYLSRHVIPAAQANENVSKPERVFADNVLTSPRDPKARLEFTAPVEYLGADRWVLYGVADCEIHVFVEAEANKQVKKLYWVQFEAYLPTVPASYDYESPDRVKLGDLEFIQDSWAAASERPYSREGSDREHVVNLIKAKGYTLPREMMSLRLVHLPDAEKRKELMIIYSEDLAPVGDSAAELMKEPKVKTKWPGIEEGLVERVQAAVRITK
jgi:hypothetical protein